LVFGFDLILEIKLIAQAFLFYRFFQGIANFQYIIFP